MKSSDHVPKGESSGTPEARALPASRMLTSAIDLSLSPLSGANPTMIHFLCKVWRSILPLATAATLLFIDVQTTLGAEEEAAGKPGKAYAISWGLILLCIVLGLLVTLRPSGRAEEVKKVVRDKDE